MTGAPPAKEGPVPAIWGAGGAATALAKVMSIGPVWPSVLARSPT